jgi:ADP-heptose:LPS heptosyltransferase
MSKSKKLIIRLSSAGDVILTSPLLKLIKQREPESEVHFVVKSKYSDLIRYNPNIDSVHLVQESAAFGELERLRNRLIGERFDSTLDLHNNFRSIYLRKETAKHISIVNKEIIRRAVLVKMKLNFYSKIRSTALKYAQVYDSRLTQVARPEIFFPEETEERAAESWKRAKIRGEKAIFFCPGSRHFTKRWPVENWTELAKTLSTKGHVALVGGEEDAATCRAIGEECPVSDFSGKFTILESAAILCYADLVITSDSFLMHAANALGKKIVAIFGSGVKEFGFFPYGVENRIMEVNGLHCRPCSHVGRESCPKKHFRCMLDTTPEMVSSAAMEILGV